LVISRLNDVREIIAIFTKYPLNSTKYLNFLAFSKAFDLYTTRATRPCKVIEEIANLKNGMNSKRIDFRMGKSYQPNITAYWLLGFIEGEASFSVRRASGKFELVFSLSQSVVDETLMNAIKDFFNKSVSGATKFESGVVNMRVYTPKGTNHKQVIQLVITRKDYFNNVLIPFFELFVLRSKKKLDFRGSAGLSLYL
jgi:hypothetical protein